MDLSKLGEGLNALGFELKRRATLAVDESREILEDAGKSLIEIGERLVSGDMTGEEAGLAGKSIELTTESKLLRLAIDAEREVFELVTGAAIKMLKVAAL